MFVFRKAVLATRTADASSAAHSTDSPHGNGLAPTGEPLANHAQLQAKSRGDALTLTVSDSAADRMLQLLLVSSMLGVAGGDRILMLISMVSSLCPVDVSSVDGSLHFTAPLARVSHCLMWSSLGNCTVSLWYWESSRGCSSAGLVPLKRTSARHGFQRSFRGESHAQPSNCPRSSAAGGGAQAERQRRTMCDGVIRGLLA